MSLPSAPVCGRGAASNPQHRFEAARREPFDDGWGGESDPPPELDTQVTEEQARSLIVRNRSPDLPFDLSINPYRGCEHGCVYCYARPYHGRLGLSSGLDFESRLYAKVNAAAVLRAELGARSYRCQPINLGSATDPYQPIERRYRLTRALLETMAAHRQPFTIVTKSALVERDIDLLAPLARDGLVAVFLSLTTLDAALARRWEPRAAAPWRRLEAMRRLREAGIPVGVGVAPIAPFLNEPEIERVLAEARRAGAQCAFYSVLRLPWEVRELFVQWLGAHYPERARRVLARLGDMRGAPPGCSAGSSMRSSEARFFARMKGEGPWAELVRLRFDMAAHRLGLGTHRFALRTDLFRVPGDVAQPELF
ncbi:MAG: PA0069 family radical SAM protein [Burkholderiales bacterium]|nr:PA0069 family radical SAM protein [Burkholderiales bacterium]OJX02277.1 MAG: radical SAM protein [Burkholderiales bacterium 70-64]